MGMDRPLVEVYPVADIFASGIGRVEKLGSDLVRITLFVDALDDLGQPIKQVVAKIIRPIREILSVNELLALTRPGFATASH